MNERDVLVYDPFAGDFGTPADRCFSDKIVTARNPGVCHDCAQPIVAGERTRRATWLFDGAVRTYRWCALCCEAMALSWADDGAAIEARFRLRK